MSWSEEMYQIFKVEAAAISHADRRLSELCSSRAISKKVVRALGKALVGEQSYNIDHRIVWPDGSVRFIHGEAAVTFDKAGRPIRMLGTVQDITVMQ